jgi:nucleoside-diphosphate-sugar epimerase
MQHGQEHGLMRIVVTGANGFVGRPVCRRLTSAGHEIVALTRRKPSLEILGSHQVTYDGLNSALAGADALVHLAARAHVLKGTESEAKAARVNIELTETLAEAAIQTGVKRFVFVSTIKVNGEQTDGLPFSASMRPAPVDEYARSKARAEELLRSKVGGKLEWVILRPPLMYGAGLRGNFARLFAIADRGIPMPFGSLSNSRDILSVNAFADLICHVVSHPAAAGRVLLVRDGRAVSTPELFDAIARSLGLRARIFPFPKNMLKLAGLITGRSDEIHRLISDLEVDDKETREVLSWSPLSNMDETLRETAAWWKQRQALDVSRN